MAAGTAPRAVPFRAPKLSLLVAQRPLRSGQGRLHHCKPNRCYVCVMEDWNDARLVLAVARAGSLTAAAKVLHVDHSTVFRRLAALEARLGLALRACACILRASRASVRGPALAITYIATATSGV